MAVEMKNNWTYAFLYSRFINSNNEPLPFNKFSTLPKILLLNFSIQTSSPFCIQCCLPLPLFLLVLFYSSTIGFHILLSLSKYCQFSTWILLIYHSSRFQLFFIFISSRVYFMLFLCNLLKVSHYCLVVFTNTKNLSSFCNLIFFLYFGLIVMKFSKILERFFSLKQQENMSGQMDGNLVDN